MQRYCTLPTDKTMQPEKSIERKTYERFNPPKRILLGPGPSPVDDRVLSAMAAPLLGHLDPQIHADIAGLNAARFYNIELPARSAAAAE